MNAPEARLSAPPADPAAAAADASLPWLVADVGGTNARFGWVARRGAAVQDIITLPVADFAGPAQAADHYLRSRARDAGDAPAPRPAGAAFAMATAIDGDRVAMTNSPWDFSCAALQQALGVRTLRVLNDFEALALSLPRLDATQLRSVGALPSGRGRLAVVGPGTGLGVAGVVETRRGWVALPGEGGHATLAATDDEEVRLIAEVRREFAHVSAERLLSGIGLPVLHRATCRLGGHDGVPLTAEQIVHGGVSGADPWCRRTLDHFCALLGSFCGNVALTLGARGGVYIGGGIVPRLGAVFEGSRFREKFEAKGRFEPYLRAIPTALITDTLAALTGAAAALEQPAD